eukprot:RCo011274
MKNNCTMESRFMGVVCRRLDKKNSEEKGITSWGVVHLMQNAKRLIQIKNSCWSLCFSKENTSFLTFVSFLNLTNTGNARPSLQKHHLHSKYMLARVPLCI